MGFLIVVIIHINMQRKCRNGKVSTISTWSYAGRLVPWGASAGTYPVGAMMGHPLRVCCCIPPGETTKRRTNMKTLEFLIDSGDIKRQPTDIPVEYATEVLQPPVEP